MFLTKINIEVEDIIRKEEIFHEMRLNKELAKYGIDFEYSNIAAYGMRVRNPKPKTEAEKYKNFLENKLNIKIY